MNENQEQHPHFPSGEWEGFYNYGAASGRKDKMEFTLNFSNQTITGTGSDQVGAFRWEGTYDVGAGTCKMLKIYYGQHTVLYDGHADENGIWGTWLIPPLLTGGFHIWPKNKEGKEAEVEALVEEKVLISFF